MLDRAAARGENPPDASAVLDHILSPIYIRTLFGMTPLPPGFTDALADGILNR